MLPFQHEKLKDIHNLLSVGVPRFERGTPCSQSRCANRTALHPETFNRHKGTHYISICNPIAPRKPFGGGDTRERSDPGGIQTHDLQNRNLTLYSAPFAYYTKRKRAPLHPLKLEVKRAPYSVVPHTLSCGFVSVWITSLPVYPLGWEQEWMLLFV